MPDSVDIVEVRGLTKRFKRFTLGPITFSACRGVNGLLGVNGAGKSTLMRLICKLAAADAGSVSLHSGLGREIDAVAGYLPQGFDAPADVRVRDYLRFIAWCRSDLSRRFSDADVDLALRRVNLLERSESAIGSLSGGMLRRLGIAQAILGEPSLLVLDEPTVGLDPLQRREIRTVITDLGASSVVLMSTHLSEDVASACRDVVILEEGTIAFEGTVTQLVGLAAADRVTAASVDEGFFAALRRRESSSGEAAKSAAV